MESKLKHVVLAVDPLSASQAATETALQLAQYHGARVTIVDTVREPSQISRWISPNATEVFDMVVADKQQRIEHLTNRFQQAGLEASGEVLFGKSSPAITRAVVHLGADLLVRYRKGTSSRYPGSFGNTARNLMRICPCPILFVAEKPVITPHVLACINVEHDVTENQAIVDAAELIMGDGESGEGVYFWELHGKDVIRGHVNDAALENLVQESESLHRDRFDKTVAQLRLCQLAGRIEMLHGDATVAIPEYCESNSIDVVVMCSALLNHPIQRFLGSTTEAVLETLPCSLLVVKPTGFQGHGAVAETGVAAEG